MEEKDKTEKQQGRLTKHQKTFFYRKSLADLRLGKTGQAEINKNKEQKYGHVSEDHCIGDMIEDPQDQWHHQSANPVKNSQNTQVGASAAIVRDVVDKGVAGTVQNASARPCEQDTGSQPGNGSESSQPDKPQNDHGCRSLKGHFVSETVTPGTEH